MVSLTSINQTSRRTTQRQNRYTGGHLALHVHRNLENKLLDALHRTRLHNRLLVLLRASRKVSQRRDSMALHLLIVLER